MPQVIYTRSAKGELHAIAKYTKEQFGLRQVKIYTQKLMQGMEKLLTRTVLDKPYHGSQISCLRVKIEQHMIFFDRLENGDIRVRRILGAQMNFERHF